MPQEIFGNLNQIIHQGNKKEFPPSKEEWKRHSAESIEKFLQALKQGFLVERYNEYEKGKYASILSNGQEKVKIDNEDYPWSLSLTLGSEDNEAKLIKYLEQLQAANSHQRKNLPDHLL